MEHDSFAAKAAKFSTDKDVSYKCNMLTHSFHFSCWASNTRHEIVNMKQPELQPNEITLPLIQDGCAVTSPPNLVTMVENGETAQAKFTVRIFSLLFICYHSLQLV